MIWVLGAVVAIVSGPLLVGAAIRSREWFKMKLWRWRENHPPKPRRRSSPLLGVRAWHLLDYPAKLRSLVCLYVWEGPTVRNPYTPTFHWDPHLPRESTCRHGFYAYSPKYFLREELERLVQEVVSTFGFTTVGVVSLYGTVVEHEQGYRAQAARIDRLWIIRHPAARYRGEDTSWADIAEWLSARYDCPCTVISSSSGAVLVDSLHEEVTEYLRERDRVIRKAG